MIFKVFLQILVYISENFIKKILYYYLSGIPVLKSNELALYGKEHWNNINLRLIDSTFFLKMNGKNLSLEICVNVAGNSDCKM